ncbi:hypothetical protein [Desertivirga xinjiangensis]|uniref:hypothetical protein n=1 Tax=Desertivirga xinjiangensis TaxID=539206 RepID=UPI00210B25E6|nr:hypothetical protein [Pedobacter xinjiangensis]
METTERYLAPYIFDAGDTNMYWQTVKKLARFGQSSLAESTGAASLTIAHNNNDIFLNYLFLSEQSDRNASVKLEFSLAFNERTDWYKFNISSEGETRVSFTGDTQDEIELPPYCLEHLTSYWDKTTCRNEVSYFELFLRIPGKLFCYNSIESFKGMHCWFMIENEGRNFHLPECCGELMFQ